MDLKIEVFVNGTKIKEIKDDGTLWDINGIRIFRNIKPLVASIICCSCKKESFWKTIPQKKYLKMDLFYCKTCRQIGEKNHMYGKTLSDQAKQKKREKMIGEKNHMYGKSVYDFWIERYGEEEANVLIKNQKERASKSLKGENNPMYGRTFYDVWLSKYGFEEAERRLEKFKESLRRASNPELLRQRAIEFLKNHTYKKTSIEVKVDNYLRELNLNFKYNFIISYYQYDFLLKDLNIIIEAHGDYWHANPIYYSNEEPNKRPLNERQKFKLNRDIEKKKYAEENGYKIIYLWETEINNEKFKEILKENGIC